MATGTGEQSRGEVPRHHRRDRHGRGLRGPLAPAHVPVVRTPSERFDDAVLDALEHLEERWAAELAGVQLVVEDVPPAGPLTDPATADEVPLGRVDPALRRRPARLVIYRRPLEARTGDQDDLGGLTRAVLTDLVAELLGLNPDDIDPGADGG